MRCEGWRRVEAAASSRGERTGVSGGSIGKSKMEILGVMTKQQRLKILRILAGFDAKKLASAMEISPGTISLWESEKKKLDISSFSLLKLAGLLGVNPEYLADGPCPDQAIFATVWQPVLPETVQHQRATTAIINSLFPEILSEMGFDLRASVHLFDGDVYLLGDKETREFSIILLVKNHYNSLFSRLFEAHKELTSLPPVNLPGSIDGFGSQTLETISVKLGKVSTGNIPKALDQFRAKDSEKEIRIDLDKLRKKMNTFLAVILKNQPEEQHIAEITNLFVAKLRAGQPGVGIEDIRKIKHRGGPL